jgi:hypothetical protein
MNKYIYILTLIGLFIFNGCRKPYLPPVVASNQSYLVVEGTINTGSDSTIIHLSHSVPLSAPAGTIPPPELNALVVIQSDANNSYNLTETGSGNYAISGLNLSSSNKYRLQITTVDKKIYQSDFVTVKNSPPIDSVNYVVKSNGLNINVNTHDPSNNTRYYRWSYIETWIIHSSFDSYAELFKVPYDTILPRPIADQIYECWQSNNSSSIVLGSSADLAQDIISQTQVTSIASTSEKISDRYSILVKQYALTSDAFNYWQQLKKNTEQLGTIFDPQPSSLTGNIHCITNPSETVLGYISAGSVTQARIFIDIRNLPAWLPISTITGCKMDTLLFSGKGKNNEVRDFLYNGNQDPISFIILRPGGPVVGYSAGDPECVDCTLRGTNVKPSFWIDQ